MLELAINGGTMIITDDNKTIVSENIATEIEDNVKIADIGEGKKPELTIVDKK